MFRSLLTPVFLAAVVVTSVNAQNAPSPEGATLLSAGSTIAGLGLLVLAGQFDYPNAGAPAVLGLISLTVGPSTGFFYTGHSGRGWRSAGLRAAMFPLAILGIAIAWDEPETGGVLMLTAAAAFAGSAIHDIATVGRSAQGSTRLRIGLDPHDRSVRLGVAIPR